MSFALHHLSKLLNERNVNGRIGGKTRRVIWNDAPCRALRPDVRAPGFVCGLGSGIIE